MRKESIENVVGLIMGDAYVQVDIRFQPMSPPNTIEEKLVLTKANADLGVLAHQLEQEIRERVRDFFAETVPNV